MSKKKYNVVVKNEFCKGCDLCIEYCKKDILTSSEKINLKGYHYAEPVKDKECIGCMVCTLVCPDLAIEVYSE